MDIRKFLTEVTRLPGTPGFEAGVNAYIAEAIRPFVDDVRVDTMQNVVATLGSEGPRIMLSAHMDEVGLAVTKVEDDGCLRFTDNSGVDPRILPAAQVRVITKGGALFGVIGAKPPHITPAHEADKPVKMDDMYIDAGLSPETAKAKVRVGDPVVFESPLTELMNGRYASKTMDDRACVCAMIVCAEALKRLRPKARVSFVASAQEERGAMGAQAAAYDADPDFAIAIDVTHAKGPGTDKWEAFDIDKMSLTYGPSLHRGLFERMKRVADEWRVPYTVEISGRYTGTDADEIHIVRGGIPCALVSVPLRYMHTTVETLDSNVIREAGRFMALFIDDMARGWEEFKWF